MTVASATDDKIVTCSRQTKIVADVLLKDVADTKFDLVVLPGGLEGAEGLRDSALLLDILKKHKEGSDTYIAAICASPAGMCILICHLYHSKVFYSCLCPP